MSAKRVLVVTDRDSKAQQKYMLDTIADIGLGNFDLEFTYVTDKEKPTAQDIKEARERIVAKVNHDVVIAAGAVALRAVVGNGSISKVHGSYVDSKYVNVPVYATYSPGVVMIRPQEERTFKADVTYFVYSMLGQHEDVDEIEWTFVTDYDKMDEVLEKAKQSKFIVYDIETSDEREKPDKEIPLPFFGKIMMIGFGFDDGSIYVVPWEHKCNTTMPTVNQYVHDIFELKKPCVAYNGKFDNRWLRSRGIYPTQTFDPYLAVYLLDENQPHSQKYQAKVRYGAPDYAKGIKYSEDEDVQKLAKYLAYDIHYLRKLYLDTKAELVQRQPLARVFKHILMPASRMLEDVEQVGVCVKPERLIDAKNSLEEAEERHKETLETLSPIKGVNWNSYKQKGRVLFGADGLALSPVKPTSTGDPSTDKETLTMLAQEHPLVKELMEYNKTRDLLKFLEDWNRRCLENEPVTGPTWRIFPSYNLARTKTGRLSSNEPNLQQVPRNKLLRNVFVATPGYVFIEADGVQQELVFAAHVAQERTMIDLIREGRDLHRFTAANIAGIPESKVTPEQRQAAKAANFGLLYGQGVKGFRRFAFLNYGVDWTLEEAKEVRDRWFEIYSGIKPWHRRCEEQIRDQGYIDSFLGRRRRLPNIRSVDDALRSAAVREGINFTVQSPASDVILLAAIHAHNSMASPTLGGDRVGRVIGLVHDSIMLEAKETASEGVCELVRTAIEEYVPNVILPKYFGVKMSVPLRAEIVVGGAWGEGTEWKGAKSA